jgi:hypothetical protein
MIFCIKYGNDPLDDYELTQRRMMSAKLDRHWTMETWFMTTGVISVMPLGAWANREAP